MSESYAVLPITSEVRDWAEGEGCRVPSRDGRAITLDELEQVIGSLPNVRTQWNNENLFRDGYLRSTDGREAAVIVGDPRSREQPCEFHFRGGEPEFIVEVVRAVAAIAGPQAIYAHSGSFLQVVG